MAEIRDYSVTADDNNAASPNGMANGCAPSTVNDTWREGIARMKRWYEDCQGAKTTTGSSNAYLLAASRVVASYAAGDAYMFKANHTNTSAGSTLNVDSVGAKAIVTPTGAAIAAGSITSGGVYLVAYEASVDKFMLIGGSHSGGDNPFIYNSSPTLTLENSTSEDTSGGRESQVVFKGLQSGSEESTLVKITASHEGTSDDQKGQLVIGVNDGNDNDAPTTAITVSSTGNTTLAGNLIIPDAGNIGSASDTDAIAISSGGLVTVSQDLTVSDDVTIGDDLLLDSDGAVIKLGDDQDVTLTHVADTGVTLSAGDNDTVLQIDSNNADAGSAPKLVLNRTTDSPADNDNGGVIKFDMENDNNQQFNAANIFAKATDVSDTTEDSSLHFQTITAGSSADALVLAGGRISSSAYSPAGSIVQVVVSAAASAFTTSTSFVDVTNASVAITPASSGNKIFVISSVDGFQGGVSGVNQIYTQSLYRTISGSDIGLSTRYLSSQSGSGGLQIYAGIAHAVLDAPSTTSEITYKLQHKVSNSGGSAGVNSGSYIIAMEVQV